MLRILEAVNGLTRRELLRVGGLAFAGLSLADVLRLRAAAPPTRASRHKSVIMVWLRGGASHIDSWDMKPNAPAEVRGEFKPIKTNVPGIHICEHIPMQAKIMDKLAILRGIVSNDLGIDPAITVVDHNKRPMHVLDERGPVRELTE